MRRTARYGHFILGDEQYYLLIRRIVGTAQPVLMIWERRESLILVWIRTPYLPPHNRDVRILAECEKNSIRRFSQNYEKLLSASSCPSVRAVHMGNRSFHWTGFSLNVLFEQFFSKTCKQILNFTRSSVLHVKKSTHFLWYLAHFFFRMRIHFQKKKCVEKIKTRILCSITFFLGAFRKIAKIVYYFRRGTTPLPLGGFSRNTIFEDFFFENTSKQRKMY